MSTDEWQLPPALMAIARAQAGFVSTGQCDDSRVDDRWRRRLVSSGRWNRTMSGVYDTGIGVVTGGPDRFDQARHRVVHRALVAYPGAVAIGAAALTLHGVRGLPRVIAVEITMVNGHHVRSRAGIRVRQVNLRGRTVRVGGVAAAPLPLAFVQALDSLDRDSWVSCVDDALRRGLISRVALAAAFHDGRRRRGVTRKRGWLDLADPLSESPLETRARLTLGDAGFLPDELQREFWSPDGSFLGRADMAWYLGGGRWLIVEIDGHEHHSSSAQLGADALRQNRLLRDGAHILLRFRAAHLHDPASFTAEVAAVLRDAGWRPGRPLPRARQEIRPR